LPVLRENIAKEALINWEGILLYIWAKAVPQSGFKHLIDVPHDH
jgi:hypothetical protein